MTRKTLTRPAPQPVATSRAATSDPYTAAIRAVAALVAEGAIPKAFPKSGALPATPLEPAGGMLAEGREDGAWIFAA